MARSTPAAAPALSLRDEDVLLVRVEQLRDEVIDALVAAWLLEMHRLPPFAVVEPAPTPGAYRVPALGPVDALKRFHTRVVHARRRRRRMRDEALALGLAPSLADALLRRFDVGWTSPAVRAAPRHLQADRMRALLVGA